METVNDLYRRVVNLCRQSPSFLSWGIVQTGNGQPKLRIETKPNTSFTQQELKAIAYLVDSLATISREGKLLRTLRENHKTGTVTVTFYEK